MDVDAAETGNLQSLLSRVGVALDGFVKFEHADSLIDDVLRLGAELARERA